MADIAALQVKRGDLIELLSLLAAEKSSLERSLARLETQLNTPGAIPNAARAPGATNPVSRIINQINEIKSDLDINASFTQRTQAELNTVNQQIATAQAQQTAQVSTGQTVKQAQAARDDGASSTNPPPGSLKTDADGRVVKAPSMSNAEDFIPGQTDAGTNAPTRKAANLQSTPPITASPGGINANVEDAYTPTNQPGAAAAGDDGAGGGVRARLNNLFGGINNKIVAQDNILDNYASYTYNISLYIMSPEDYGRMLRDKQKRLYGSQLLMRSGGAPISQVSGGNTGGQTDPAEGAGTTQSLGLNVTGRSQFFPLDYYIDDVMVRSIINGKGVRGAHNVTELKFKLIENNGITFLSNLFAATQQYIKISGGAGVNKNYAAQNYLMVIRFYGYDDQGNLVTASKSGKDAAGTDVNAIVEKFIPFQFTGIRFRIANKLVEYDCSAVCPQNNVNTGVARGTIPYNVELQSQTLNELLSGTQKFASTSKNEGRVVPAGPMPAFEAGVFNPEVYGP